jgi:hypothetical protein
VLAGQFGLGLHREFGQRRASLGRIEGQMSQRCIKLAAALAQNRQRDRGSIRLVAQGRPGDQRAQYISRNQEGQDQ